MAIKTHIDHELVAYIRDAAKAMLLAYGIDLEAEQEGAGRWRPLNEFKRLIEERTAKPLVFHDASPKPVDPWDQGKRFVCGTCVHFLSKSETVGRCKARPPTHRGYVVVYPHERACGKHRLKTSKA